ncbi:uncharacterized protein LOC144440083 [Glandiceps talaboti]
MAFFNVTVKLVVLLSVCLGAVYCAELCAECSYNEWYYDTNRDCLEAPETVSTVECNTRCYTYGYYDIFDNLRVERGCDTSNSYDWEDGCDNVDLSTYIKYVCTCNDTDSCNTDDSAYNTCYQCDKTYDSDCYDNAAATEALPCFTGGDNCASDITTYASSLLSLGSSVVRYCTDEDVVEPTDCRSGQACTYICNGDNCNTRAGAAYIYMTPIVLISAFLLSALIG